MYEKFYEKSDLKAVREIVDCEGGDSPGISRLVSEEPPELTDYLNFFEFVAVLKKSHQLSANEIESLFWLLFRLFGEMRRGAKLDCE